jgi:hypothetical protein
MSNVVVAIDRTSLSLAALEISGLDDARDLGLASYQEPGLVPRISYMPDARDVHGSEDLGFAWQQGIISFEVFPRAVDEAAARALIDQLRAALGRLNYTVTTTVGNAPPQVWSALVGSIELTRGRNLDDLTDSDPSYSVSIPVYPIAS